MRFQSGRFLPALALCFGAIGASAVGCELIASVDRTKIQDALDGGSGTGGTGGDTSSTTGPGAGGAGGKGGGGGTGGSGGCMQPMNECMQASCANNACSEMPKPDLTPVSMQAMGDCQRVVCDGMGGTKMEDDDTDVANDMKACTMDSCTNGMAVHTPVAPGSACAENGGTKCNATGDCVQCTVPMDCTMANEVCKMGLCVPDTCVNASMDGMETDLDCGGPECNPCGTNKNCMMGTDCVSMVCTGNKCQAAACNDTVKNGSETDVDCGGSCPGCADGQMCADPTDCMSGVCANNVCQMPTCQDGVKNGNETDQDCGGGMCGGCGTGKLCMMDSDCVSNSCLLGLCSPLGMGGMGGGGGAGGAGGGGGAGGN
jgi:hypothetical protein